MTGSSETAGSLETDCVATIGFAAAQAVLRERCVRLGVESVPLARAGRRVLAEAVRARIDAPRRDCAAMDGYAVRSDDLAGPDNRLRLCGESVAGGRPPPPLAAGTAVRISTGAPLPPGADRVVMRERARVEGDALWLPGVSGKAHVRPRASDFGRGATLLAPGTPMESRAMVVAAAGDVDRVPVWRRPRLHLLSNGDELAAPGMAAPDADRIPDSLSEGLLLFARQWGAKPGAASRAGDRVEALTAAAEAALAEADIVVMVGGASHGRRDFARAALDPLGLRLDFAGVAMKPGKPFWYGRIGATHILGLPGNPTAAMTVARLFLAPLLSGIAGAGFDAALTWVDWPSLDAVAAGGERDHFLCGAREGGGARILERQQASSQMMLAQADLLVERRAGAAAAAAGTPLRCLRF